MTGAFLYTHPRFAPSTKVCSGCGQLHDMPLGKSVLNCDCGLTIDRDISGKLCRGSLWRDRLWRCFGGVKPVSMKQEEISLDYRDSHRHFRADY